MMYHHVETMDPTLFTVMVGLMCLSIFIALFFIANLLCLSHNKVIKAASWRLNVLMCVGATLFYLSAMLYCVGEGLLEDAQPLDTLCTVRLWTLTISFSVLFMPLFAKTYRLSRMFKNILRNTVLGDARLFFIVLGCITVDVVLLGVFTIIAP